MNASMELKSGSSLRFLSWTGRSSRMEFWLIFGLYMLICMLAPIVVFVTFSFEHEQLQRLLIIFLPQLSTLYLLLAAGSRRLQDAGISNGIQALPVGLFVALVFFAWSRDTHDANMLAFLPYCGFALLSLTWWYLKRSNPAQG